ncbi:hypothetical protein SAMN05660350_01090 [Geodermatophilus obscurus]|uniref:Uncharacterized protein n=1 Tax=Geodermatophilus obscurus TaxID=1861 RepID=A0A1M7SWF1_9ACTN|nr:hypothetical protein [Geodermatophilus obscurus]SHN62781.1 hypothetical protein SAMN05660350_01090 [Geodermatophilus obscurus]
MTTTATDWHREDQAAAIAAAEENLRQAQAEVDRLRGKLTDAQAAKDAAGVGSEPSAAELGRREAQRRIAQRAGKAPDAATGKADPADEAPRDTTAADGIAEARRRAAARTSAR